MTDDTLVIFGGSVKALDDKGKVGGHLVLFGSADQTDASRFRDFFTKDTDFALDVSGKSRLKYAHALDPTLRNRTLGIGNLKADKVGIWVEGQLEIRDEYEQKIWGMIKDGKLGWSSGTMPNLIEREKQANGSQKIISWPLGLDASLTPCPAEYRTQAMALKSLTFEGLKGEHLGDHVENRAMMNAVQSIHDQLGWTIGDTLRDPKGTKATKLAKVKGAHNEARDTALKMIGAMIPDPPATEGTATKDLDLLEAELRLRDAQLGELLDFEP